MTVVAGLRAFGEQDEADVFRYLDRLIARLEHADSSLDLPYGVTAPAIVEAVNDVYAHTFTR